MTAAETYASQIDDYNAQQARIYGDRLPPDSWATGAASFRYDSPGAFAQNPAAS